MRSILSGVFDSEDATGFDVVVRDRSYERFHYGGRILSETVSKSVRHVPKVSSFYCCRSEEMIASKSNRESVSEARLVVFD